MTIEGYAVMLMKECRLSKQHIHNLLLPLSGNFPSNEEQLQVLIEGIKKIGLLHDDGPNTLGQLLNGGHSRHSFPVEAEEVPAGATSEQPENVFTTWSWDLPQAQPSFPAAMEDDSDSSSATSSVSGPTGNGTGIGFADKGWSSSS